MADYENYVKLRNSLDLKDIDVARQADIPPSTFTDWKKGKSTPKETKLEKIANVLGVTTYELRTGFKPEMPKFEPEHDMLIHLYSSLKENEKAEFMELVKKYVPLDAEKKNAVLTVVRSLSL